MKKFLIAAVVIVTLVGGAYKYGLMNSKIEFRTEKQTVVVDELDAMTEEIFKSPNFQAEMREIAKVRAGEKLIEKVEKVLDESRGKSVSFR